MKTYFGIGVLGLLNLAALAFMVSKVSDLDARISQVHAPVAPASAPADTSPAPAFNVEPIQRKAVEIWPRVKEVATTWVQPTPKTLREIIVELSELIGEIDGWIFTRQDQKLADEILDRELELLKTLIRNRVGVLSQEAVVANTKVATARMAEINQLLALYPSPNTDKQRAELATLTGGVLATSRRVEDVMRLRYNAWALDKIEGGLNGYHSVDKESGLDGQVRRDRFIKECLNALKEINTSFLDPPAFDLYNYVYGLTLGKLKNEDPSRVTLARGFADPTTKRKTPFDFDQE